MNKTYKIINESAEIPDNYKYYWGYQYRLGYEVVVPYIQKLNAFTKDDSVAEVGSAEGGVLAAFIEAGAKNGLGTDISQSRLDMGVKISELTGLPIEFKYHDILNDEIDQSWKNSFNLVILRDVIEHLDHTSLALKNIKKMLKPGGFIYVTFPPYYSPFGGHQHTVMNFWGKLPYIHYLPNSLFHKMLQSGRQNDIGEVKRLQEIKLTPSKFINAAKDAGFEIFHQDYYFLRPVFKMKFGLPTIKSTLFSFIPLMRSVFSLEASYLLKSNG